MGVNVDAQGIYVLEMQFMLITLKIESSGELLIATVMGVALGTCVLFSLGLL